MNEIIRVMCVIDPEGNEGYFMDREQKCYTFDNILSKIVFPHKERYLIRSVESPFLLDSFLNSKYVDYFLMFERLWLRSKE